MAKNCSIWYASTQKRHRYDAYDLLRVGLLGDVLESISDLVQADCERQHQRHDRYLNQQRQKRNLRTVCEFADVRKTYLVVGEEDDNRHDTE